MSKLMSMEKDILEKEIHEFKNDYISFMNGIFIPNIYLHSELLLQQAKGHELQEIQMIQRSIIIYSNQHYAPASDPIA